MGDVFRSLRTRSGDYLEAALRLIESEGSGVFVYLRLEDMGDRLIQRVQSYNQLDEGDTPDDTLKKVFRSDDRDYGVGAQILHALGIHKIRLITNSHAKRAGLERAMVLKLSRRFVSQSKPNRFWTWRFEDEYAYHQSEDLARSGESVS